MTCCSDNNKSKVIKSNVYFLCFSVKNYISVLNYLKIFMTMFLIYYENMYEFE